MDRTVRGCSIGCRDGYRESGGMREANMVGIYKDSIRKHYPIDVITPCVMNKREVLIWQ
jgi:hypothetical protein